MRLIKTVKTNRYGDRLIEGCNQAILQLQEQGVECLVIAYTELSVIADRIISPLPIFDTSQLLAEHIVEVATKK